MNLTKLIKSTQKSIKKHSPEILTGIGIAGMIASTIMAVRATPKALQLIEEKKEETQRHSLTVMDTIEASWKCYVPATVTGVMSVICLIGASSVNLKRNAALATAYTISETAMREYKDKVVETIGTKKEQEVRDAIAKDHIEKNPISKRDVVVTNKGNTLCYDTFSGRYFKSDIETIKKIVNELNRRLLNEDYLSLNEFYYELGLDGTYIGDRVGWRVDNGLIEVNFSAQLAEDGTPCIALAFINAPNYEY